jgi:steroid delta-isomerase
VDEVARKQLALEYVRRLNAGDVDGVLALFAEDVRFTDPVGVPPVVGRRALRTHLASAVAAHVHEVPGTPVAARDGRHVALPVTATLDYLPLGPALAAAGMLDPTASVPRAGGTDARLRFHLISVMGVGPGGLLDEVRVFWGRTDTMILVN